MNMTIEDIRVPKLVTMLTLNVMKQPIDQTWSVARIANEAPPRTWEAVFEDAKPELHDISLILEEQERTYGQYYPLRKDIFAAFQHTQLANVKVVILGQDPYHQTITVNGMAVPRAVGLSFSVRREDAIPSSLQNIYTELANTVRGFTKPDHGDLREWADQGVLLLNTCLTVRPGQAGSHGDIWLGFINKVFKAIAAVNPNCIYLLWGREAQKIKPMLGDRSIVLEAAHPSGLSARRGFFGCNHFNLTNDHLIRQGKVGINWKLSSLAELTAPPPRLTTLPYITTNGHQPKFVPVDVAILPTTVPIKLPTVNTVPIPTVTIPQQYRSTPSPIPVLPIIPNTKPNSPPMTYNKSPPSPPVLDNTNQTKSVPIIPKIQFGGVITTPPPILLGTPQILSTPIIQKTDPIIHTPTINGLPIIPSLIN